jgi:hypothetical protein
MRIRIFSSFSDSKNCKDVYERLCETSALSNYGPEKDYYFTDEDDYTHIIIQNTAMPSISHIPKENVLGLAFEPPRFLGLTNQFVEYAQKYIGAYFIGDTSGLPHPFREHFGYMWHMTPPKSIPEKSKIMSIAFSAKKHQIPGYIFRHDLVKRILASSLPIDLYGHGCRLYSDDARLKGPFCDEEPYKSYTFSICIENFQTNHYFSEKIMNPLLVGTTPIYYGAKTIDDYFPDMVIRLPENLDDIMSLLDSICRNPSAFQKNIQTDRVKETISLVKNLNKYFKQ